MSWPQPRDWQELLAGARSPRELVVQIRSCDECSALVRRAQALKRLANDPAATEGERRAALAGYDRTVATLRELNGLAGVVDDRDYPPVGVPPR